MEVSMSTKDKGESGNKDKKFIVTDKEADRWDVFGDFGIDPRVVAARKKNPRP